MYEIVILGVDIRGSGEKEGLINIPILCVSDHHCLRRGHHSSEDAAWLSTSTDRSRGGKQSDRLVIKRS